MCGIRRVRNLCCVCLTGPTTAVFPSTIPRPSAFPINTTKHNTAQCERRKPRQRRLGEHTITGIYDRPHSVPNNTTSRHANNETMNTIGQEPPNSLKLLEIHPPLSYRAIFSNLGLQHISALSSVDTVYDTVQIHHNYRRTQPASLQTLVPLQFQRATFGRSTRTITIAGTSI